MADQLPEDIGAVIKEAKQLMEKPLGEAKSSSRFILFLQLRIQPGAQVADKKRSSGHLHRSL
jgi:hypothetical protein